MALPSNEGTGVSRRAKFSAMLLIAVGAYIAATAIPERALSQPPVLWEACGSGSLLAECNLPRGIASSSVDGSVYIGDQDNKRVLKLTTWGVFVRTFGWKVNRTKVEAGAPEVQQNLCPVDPGDVCQAGSNAQGVDAGQGRFGSPQGLAVDSAGGVYVVDRPNHRVQKFDAEGGFILMFGGKVNKTKVEAAAPAAQQNLCPIDPGDICQAGTIGTGNGQFGEWTILGDYIDIDTKSTASAADDIVYVGDVGRIQRFDASGIFKSNFPNVEDTLTEKKVSSLGVVPSGSAAENAGDLFVAFQSLANEPISDVVRLNTSIVPGAPFCKAPVVSPKGVATDPSGNVYVIDGASNPKIREFGPFCIEEPNSNFPFQDGFDTSTGIAIGSACLTTGTNLYLSNSVGFNGFVRAYGPAPDKPTPGACQPPIEPPEILAQYPASVGTTNASLQAIINPKFWADTTFFVQYGTAACVEAGGWSSNACIKSRPVPPELLGAGAVNSGERTPGVLLEGLAPGLTYHFRFVAESGGGGPIIGVNGTEDTEGESGSFTTYRPLVFDACANKTFRVGPSAGLPDCRAYEMVSPIDKNGGDIVAALSVEAEKEAAFRQASTNGNKITYTSTTSFGDAARGTRSSQYISTRGAGGWSTHGINPPQGVTIFDPGFVNLYDLNANFQAFTPDLCFALLNDQNLVPLDVDGLVGFPNLYVRDNCGQGADTYRALTVGSTPVFFGDPKVAPPQARAYSDDLSHVVFTMAAALESEPPAASQPNLQVYDFADGKLSLVSVLPDEQPAATNSHLGGPGVGEGFLTAARSSNLDRAVSDDGSRIFWSTDGKIYVRINGAKTLEVSQGMGNLFWTASGDGSTAIYSQSGKLFAFDVGTESRQEIAGGIGGVVGASEDLSHLYFTSTEAIPGSGRNSEEDEAEEGEWNLYLSKEDSIRFIATVAPGDREFFGVDEREPILHSSRVTPDGAGLAFMSTRPLTDFDNADVVTGELASEIFVYDASSQQLKCVSCNPSGARPRGRRLLRSYTKIALTPIHAAAWIPTWEWSSRASRSLSEDGKRVFFNSFDALVPGDVNKVQDVYEWEASGTGSCDIDDPDYFSVNGGCINLISTGKNGDSTTFIDASSNGSDVFISTASNIAPGDLGFIDIYDAREGGGFAPPPAPPPVCEGDACQNVPPPPEVQTPSSATFRGPGNQRADRLRRKRCGKGKRKVQRGGKRRCVPKHKGNSKRRVNHGRRMAP